MTAAHWVLSIDFGTSYTVVASRVHGRAAEVIEIDGERRVPSVVMITDEFGVVIGRAADEMAAAAPSRVLRSPKSRLGDPAPIILGGRPFQATSLVAEVLAKVYDEALRHHGSTPESTRLTYPASWSGQRRQQLLRAAELAGLENVTLVPEPVAAAIAYADESAAPVGSTVLVYDLGGGTLDCAVLRTTESGFEFVGRPGGDRHLGGELFDELLANMIGERLPDDVWEQLQLGEDTVWRQAWVGLRREARRAKELLSTQMTVDILIALPTGIREMRISRADVDGVVGPYIADSVQILRDTAADAGVAIADIGAIYLVGGGSRMPLVETLLAEAFPGTLISRRGDPKAAVALGGTHPAAIIPQAALAQAADQVTDPRPKGAVADEETESIPVVAAGRTGQPSTRMLANWPSPEAATVSRTRRHRVAVLTVAVALAIALGGLGVWAAGRDDNPKAAADTVPQGSVETTPESASPTATSAAVSSTSAPATSTTMEATTTTGLPTDDLLGVVTGAPEASSFRRIVEAAGLQQLLVDPQPFTLFVPTNDGFTAAFAGTGLSVDAIVARPAAAFALVAQHLVVDPTLSASSEGTFTTRAGTTLTVEGGRVDGNLFGGEVWRGTNGNAWPIEGVLLPPGFSIVDVPVSSLAPATPTTVKRGGGTSPTTVAPSGPVVTTAPTAPATTAPPATDPTVPPTTAATSGMVPAGLEGKDPSSSIATIKQAGFSHVATNFITCAGQGNVVSSYTPQGTQPFNTTISVTICN